MSVLPSLGSAWVPPLARMSGQTLVPPSAQPLVQPSVRTSAKPWAQTLAKPLARKLAEVLAHVSVQASARASGQALAQPSVRTSEPTLAGASAQRSEPASAPAWELASPPAGSWSCRSCCRRPAGRSRSTPRWRRRPPLSRWCGRRRGQRSPRRPSCPPARRSTCLCRRPGPVGHPCRSILRSTAFRRPESRRSAPRRARPSPRP
mmetsp:Transcript_35611/g.80809  ORF Transcript_35611/g.80809 Transcript_35611/m.80809 type:complete len:205 (+) Transcript_35611:518-1132(+)